MAEYFDRLTATIRGLLASRQDLLLEDFALRHQRAMCLRRPHVSACDRLLWGVLFQR